MKHKKKVTEQLKFDIPMDLTNRYKPPITVGDIIACKDILNDDVLLEYYYEEREVTRWGLSVDDDPEYHFVPVVEVSRTRWETDSEFEERLVHEGKIEKNKEQQEYQEYLRLKGKFEN